MIHLVGSLGIIVLSFKWLVNIKIKIKLKTTKNYSNGDALAILFLLYCSTKIIHFFETTKFIYSIFSTFPFFLSNTAIKVYCLLAIVESLAAMFSASILLQKKSTFS